jgi:glucose-1-phosphate thymidylyltransferase
MNKAVILAAGKGSRLFPVTKAIAKPILPLANRLTMEYAFDQLKECGLDKICIVVGENEAEMRSALGDGSRFGVNLSYAVQSEPLGLAHAVGCASNFAQGDPFALYLGDAIYTDSLKPFVDQFNDSDAAAMLLVREVEDPRRFGVANIFDDKIVRLVEKPENPESNWALAGFYVFGAEIWQAIPRVKPSFRGELEITDAVQLMVDEGLEVLPGRFEGEWFDTGTLPSFLETSRRLVGDRLLLGAGAVLKGESAGHVVIGDGAEVNCRSIFNSVVLPGANVNTTGDISGSLIGGSVNQGEFKDQIVWGGPEAGE